MTISTPRTLGAVALVLTLVAPAALHAVLHVEEIQQTRGRFDHRVASVPPSAAALAAAASLPGAVARWNRFGTVHTLAVPGGFLAEGLTGEPAVAAREWILQHRALFGLSAASVAALELERDSVLEDGSARVLLFGQRAGGVRVGPEGSIKVGVVDGKIFWVASSAIGDVAALPPAVLPATQAWMLAATAAGLPVPPPISLVAEQSGEWTVIEAPGISHDQHVRLVALGVPGQGAVPAWETWAVHLDGGALTGYRTYVDAVSGALLVGEDRVRQAMEGEGSEPLPAEPHVFTGSYPPGQATECGPCHGPFTAAPDHGWDRLVFGIHHLAGGDITFKVFRDDPTCAGIPVHDQDLLTTPEYAVIEPVAAGDWYAKVCPFDVATNTAAGDYAGTATFAASDSPNANPKWRFFPASPPLDFSSTDTRVLGCWQDTAPDGSPLPECDLSLVEGSSHGITWDWTPPLSAPSHTTTGNAARASEAWGAFLSGGGPYQPVVTNPDPTAQRVYDFPWTNQWFESACDPTILTHSGALLPDADIDAAIANLFALHNQVHDWAYHLGYRERQGAAQLSNYGQTGPESEHDFELGNAQAGAVTSGWPAYNGRDNANQLPTPDGVPPLTNMYLWQTIGGAIYVPCVDGDFDAGVIAHEYGHLIQHRMVDPANGLGGDAGGAMGESWSDLTAIGLLNEYSRVPVAGENPFGVGTYITDPQKGIRNYAMNASPLNYSDVGYDFVCADDVVDGTCLAITQVHADGEIWSAVNFDIRQALAAAYDAQFPSGDAALAKRCADGQVPSDMCPGTRRWSQLMHDAMLLVPNAPSMVDARDAYLAADLARSVDPVLAWGSNQEALWLAFARRGFGEEAAAANGDDFDPEPDFASPLADNATVTFELVSAEDRSTPVVGEVYVGVYEARATPIADTDPASPRPATRRFAPGTYDLVARADGYGHFRFSITVDAGRGYRAEVEMPANWASSTQGASAAGDGVDHADLIDDTEATNWERTGATPSVDDERPRVAVAFAGPRTVNRVQVSGMLEAMLGEAMQNRFSAIHGFRVLACDATVADCGTDAGYTEILSAPDAFPSSRLRALVPDVTLRSFPTAGVQATHLVLEALHNKCSGTPGYQGYLGVPGQDDGDPANGTDCRTGSPPLLGPKNVDVRVAELQAFGREGRVRLRRQQGAPAFLDGFESGNLSAWH